jgi:NADH-quinone oxidoreductase subunit J
MVGMFFAYFALVSIAAGVLTVTLRHPVHCALSLLVLLMHVSGLFILLNAEFLWAVQVIVYVGAILVLYLFVLMLMNLILRSPFDGAKGDTPASAVLQDGNTYAVGIKMFSDHLLQFEIVGIFLLGAIIGAIVLAKTPKPLNAEKERL